MRIAEGRQLVALMADISAAFAGGSGVDATLRRCTEALVRDLGAAFARVWTCEPGSDALILRASAGLYTRLDGTHSRIRVGDLKIGRIAAERRPHLTNAVLDDPSVDDKPWARREGMVAFAGYPLLVDGRTVGVMALFAREPLSGDVLEALAAVADAVAQYVERERAEADVRRAHALLELQVEEGARQLSTLMEVGRELASTHELAPLLGSLLGRLKAVVDYDGAAILLREGEHLRYAAVGGPDRWEEARHVRYSLAQFQSAWGRLRHDVPIIVGDVRDDSPDARLFRANTEAETGLDFIRSLMWVPLVLRGRITGLLSIARGAPHAFLPRDAELALAIARHAAVAIENARLHERARDAAVLEERQRLARELHDSVTQALYSLKMYAEAANRKLDVGDLTTARAHLGEVRATAGEALAEMRLLLHELRPPVLREHGLGAALRARLAAVEGRSGLTTDARVDEDIRLPAPVEQDLYRIAQEALNNVVKHARASRITLAFEAADGYARLEVADDGAGFDPEEPHDGLGLTGMQERAAHIGGAIRVESTPGAGTRIVVEVPR